MDKQTKVDLIGGGIAIIAILIFFGTMPWWV